MENNLYLLRSSLSRASLGECADEIARLRADKPQSKCVMLVPEHHSFETEKQFVKKFGIIGINGINVFTPRKLAVNFLCARSLHTLRPSGKEMLVAKAVRLYCDKAEETRLTASMRREGFAGSVSALISEMKRYNISPRDLFDANIRNDRLREKIFALAAICDNYERLLRQGGFTDADEDTELLTREIYVNKYFDENTYVWADGFDELLPSHISLIGALKDTCARVTVRLSCPDTDAIEDETERRVCETVCAPVFSARQRLIDIFGAKDVFPRAEAKSEAENETEAESESEAPTEKPSRIRRVSPEISHFLRFYESGRVYSGDAPNIAIFECRDPHAEAEYIASKILELVRGGMRFRDIGVIFGGAIDYAHIINAVFAEHDIPFFADEKITLSDHPIAMQILSVFDIIESDWNYEAVFKYLHAGFIYEKTDGYVSRISSDDVALLENYAMKRGIRGRSRWIGTLSEDGFNEKPWTLTKEIFEAVWEENGSGEENAELDKINEIRFRVTAPFKTLILGLREIKGKARAADYAALLARFLEAINMYEGLQSDVRRLEGDDPEISNPHSVARQFAQIWTEILDVIDQAVVTAGEDEMSFLEFGDSIAAGLSKSEIRIIPSSLDSVYTGTAERFAVSEVRALFAAGAVSGTYPDDIPCEGFLSNSDRELLSDAGIVFAPTTKKRMDLQYFKVYKALCAAGEKLYFSYPVQNGEGGVYRPARIISDTANMFPRARRGDNLVYDPADPANITSPPAARRALMMNCADPIRKLPQVWKRVYRCFEETDPASLRLIDEAAAFGRRRIGLTEDTAHALYDRRIPDAGTGRLYSATNIDTYAKCPMMYFMRYGLKARENGEQEIDRASVGTYAHMLIKRLCSIIEDGAESFEEKREKWEEWAKKSDEEFKRDFGELTESVTDKTIAELEKLRPYDTEQRKRSLRRISKTVAASAENVYKSITEGEFVPLGYEQDFGIRPLTDEVYIRGMIDRTDESRRENGARVFRVIDYKTGSTKFNRNDIKNGVNMQLFIYALAAMRFYGGDMELTGVYYQPVNDRITLLKPGEKAQDAAKDGRLLDGITFADKEDVEIARLYCRGIEDKENSASADYLRLSLVKKRDKFDSRTIASTEERAELFKTVEDNILGIDKEIMSGAIRAYPLARNADGSVCSFCDYRDACVFEKEDMEYRKKDGKGFGKNRSKEET